MWIVWNLNGKLLMEWYICMIVFLLFSTEAFGTTWSKHYCQYTKENRIFTMIPYTQTIGKIVSCLFLFQHYFIASLIEFFFCLNKFRRQLTRWKSSLVLGACQNQLKRDSVLTLLQRTGWWWLLHCRRCQRMIADCGWMRWMGKSR